MDDYTKMIENIKMSEIRVACITKEVNELNEESKKIESEIEKVKAQKKQLIQELKYKKKIVVEKEWELDSLNRLNDVWKCKLEEKKVQLDERREKVEEIQRSVWNTRITFSNYVGDFLKHNDVVMNWDSKMEEILKKREERNRLVEDISKLEFQVECLTEEYKDLKCTSDMASHLERERETLSNYEQSHEVRRLMGKTELCRREMDVVEAELYNLQTVSHPTYLEQNIADNGCPDEEWIRNDREGSVMSTRSPEVGCSSPRSTSTRRHISASQMIRSGCATLSVHLCNNHEPVPGGMTRCTRTYCQNKRQTFVLKTPSYLIRQTPERRDQ